MNWTENLISVETSHKNISMVAFVETQSVEGFLRGAGLDDSVNGSRLL